MVPPKLPWKSWEMPVYGISSCVETFRVHYAKCQQELKALECFRKLPVELRLKIEREVRLSIFRIILDEGWELYTQEQRDRTDQFLAVAKSSRYQHQVWGCHSDAYFTKFMLEDSTPLPPMPIDLSHVPHKGNSRWWFRQFYADRMGEIIEAEAAEAFYAVNRIQIYSQHLQTFLNERARLWTVRKLICKLNIIIPRYATTPDLSLDTDLAGLTNLPRLTEVGFILLDNHSSTLKKLADKIAALEKHGISKISLHGREPIIYNEKDGWTLDMKAFLCRTCTMRIWRESLAPVNLAQDCWFTIKT